MRRTVQRSEADRDDVTRQLKRMYRSVAKEERDAVQLLHTLTDSTTTNSISNEYSSNQLVSPTTTTACTRKPAFNSANSEYYAGSDHGSTCSSCGSGSNSNSFLDLSAVVPGQQHYSYAQLKLLAKRCVQVEAQLRLTEHRCASVTQEGIAIAKALQQLQQATASSNGAGNSGSGDYSANDRSNSKQQQLEDLKQLKHTQLQQAAYVARQQGLRVKCEAYKTTVLTQEQVIAKLEQALAAATAATTAAAAAASRNVNSTSTQQQPNSSRGASDTAELQRLRDENVTLKAALESLGNGSSSNEQAQVTELESVLQTRDDKLQILEDQMIQNARAAQAQITQLKLQIMELEMQALRT
jgi:hypothetical protein